jgi:hypothetical protein
MVTLSGRSREEDPTKTVLRPVPTTQAWAADDHDDSARGVTASARAW